MVSFHERLYALQQQMEWRIERKRRIRVEMIQLTLALNTHFGKMGNRFGRPPYNFKLALETLTELRKLCKK